MKVSVPSYFQIISCEVNKFGNAIVSLTDKGQLSIWNPMNKRLFYDEKDQIVNSSPEEELNFSDEASFQSCCFTQGDRFILASNFTADCTRSIAIYTTVPNLRHLCRLIIRKNIPESRKLSKLSSKIPPRILKFLSYDIWW